jgi:hypothetical protein
MDSMPRFSPTLEGFRVAFRRPSLSFAEIAWHWSVGLSAVLLFTFAVIEYLDTVPVTNLDADLLATRQPLLVWRALVHIFRGSLNRVTLAALLGLFALTLLWIVAASIGRLAIVRVLIECCRASRLDRSLDAVKGNASAGFSAIRSLVGLNFLRAVATIAALPAFLGAAMAANMASPGSNPRPVLALLIFLLLAAGIVVSWIALKWLLSFAPIFVVRDGEGAVGAISAALSVVSERLRPVLAVSICNLVAHFAVFVIAAGVASMLLAFISIVPATLVASGIILVALVYFAVVDWLYVARLAGYVCIGEMPEASTPSVILPAPHAAGGESATDTPPRTAVDRDEPILSDRPGMAFQLAPQS